MALNARQRNKLPASAFVYPQARKYPVPTKAQAAKAGISEAQRLRVHRSALSYAGRSDTSGNYGAVAKAVKARSGGKITPGRFKGGGRRG
jgi:hypothetical protein